MKLYRLIREEKQITVTHSKGGKPLKKPRTETQYFDKKIECQNPTETIYERLTRGHLETRVDRLARYLAALTVDNKEEMAKLLTTDWSEYYTGEYDRSYDELEYKFED